MFNHTCDFIVIIVLSLLTLPFTLLHFLSSGRPIFLLLMAVEKVMMFIIIIITIIKTIVFISYESQCRKPISRKNQMDLIFGSFDFDLSVKITCIASRKLNKFCYPALNFAIRPPDFFVQYAPINEHEYNKRCKAYGWFIFKDGHLISINIVIDFFFLNWKPAIFE